MTRCEGLNGQLSVEGDTLVLTREGRLARGAYGKNVSPRRIPLTAISGVRSRPATRLLNGWLQLLIGGVDGGKPRLTESHPDRVSFNWYKREQFEELERLLVETAERNNAHGDPAAASANADAGTAGPTFKQALNPPPRTPKPSRREVEARAALAEQGILFQGLSHDEGRNAVITLYQDRIERHRAAKLTSASSTRQDMEETPVRAISSIQARKDGAFYTKVTVYASGNNIEFRLDHHEAERFRLALGPLIRGGHSAAPAGPAPAPSLAEQLRDLAALRDEGVLTDDEFAAQKAKLLGS